MSEALGAYVISGPTAVGKGTVVAALKKRHPRVFVSVSVTTRPPRPGEINGVHYLFVDDAVFDDLVADDGLLEWARVHGVHRYGTPRKAVADRLAEGVPTILEIDLQGARQVKSNLPEARLVFLTPPSWDELVTRLKGRGTEDTAAQERRLETAKLELAAIAEADHVIENAVVDATVAELARLLDL